MISSLNNLNVFVSSTWLDLKKERSVVEKALQRMREIKFIGMEYFGSRENDSAEASLFEVGKCHIYLAVIGHRYGSAITEAEYIKARSLNLPCFIYFKSGGNPKKKTIKTDIGDEEKLELFKSVLKKNHLITQFSSPDKLAVLIIADLHRWIMDTLGINDQGNLASEGSSVHLMNQFLTATNQLRFIVQQFSEKISQAKGEDKSKPADPSGSQIDAHYAAGQLMFKILSLATANLSQHIRIKEFQALVAERTKDFVGRKFIFSAIDEILSKKEQFPSGYIIIQGEPGIGKTALSAQLVKARGYVHHFNVASQNIRSTQDFLANICAQLIIRFELEYSSLPATATRDGGFLNRILNEISLKAETTPVVIVVDALDEAEEAALTPNDNRLFLPQVLPSGIFFILTTRPKYEYRLNVDSRRDIFIEDGDPLNQQDILEFINNFFAANSKELLLRVEASKVPMNAFVDILVEKSEGNFMYLVHVLKDIRNGLLNVDSFDNMYKLPKGLREYYLRHWRYMQAQDPPRFRDYYEPIVCMLATAREPVAISQIVEWTKKRWPQLNAGEIKNVIKLWWEFLNEDRSAEPPLYRIYHTSFQDFLKEEVGLEFYHDIIVMNALEKIPGFSA